MLGAPRQFCSDQNFMDYNSKEYLCWVLTGSSAVIRISWTTIPKNICAGCSQAVLPLSEFHGLQFEEYLCLVLPGRAAEFYAQCPNFLVSRDNGSAGKAFQLPQTVWKVSALRSAIFKIIMIIQTFGHRRKNMAR